MIEPHPASIQDRDGAGRSCKPPAACFLSSSGSLLMADMPANASPPRPASSSKSSPRARIRSALLFCRADGWSSGSLPGSAATEGLPKISRPASTPPGPSFTPLPSCCSHAASRGTHEFRNRLLDYPGQSHFQHPKLVEILATIFTCPVGGDRTPVRSCVEMSY